MGYGVFPKNLRCKIFILLLKKKEIDFFLCDLRNSEQYFNFFFFFDIFIYTIIIMYYLRLMSQILDM